MREDLLHFVWRTQRFVFDDLVTTTGEVVEIEHLGNHNVNAGPDFLSAKVRIGDTLWAGNVEMHLKSSDWIKHEHSDDSAYDTVILHVVLEEDIPVFRKNGSRIPCIELKKRISEKLSKTYLKLINSEYWIACQHHFNDVSDLKKMLWLDRVLVERLKKKTEIIEALLKENNYHWEEVFYRILARNFGVKVNSDAFEQLARVTPISYLAKHKNNLFQLEALLFGQSGLLSGALEEDYPIRLKKEYDFLKKKYKLSPLSEQQWKFMRMRPANFPTVRIAQFAQLVCQSVHLFSKVLEIKTIEEFERLFSVEPSPYWLTHYLFDKESPKRSKKLGKTAIHLIIINTIVPFLFLYGNTRNEEAYKQTAFRLLEALKPEKNSIINGWRKLGMEPQSAYQTQALIHLKNEYCNRKKCLECSIGAAILK